VTALRGRRRKSDRGDKLLGFVAETEPPPKQCLFTLIWISMVAKRRCALELSGSIVAIDPQNGRSWQLVNRPSYVPGEFPAKDEPQDLCGARGVKSGPFEIARFRTLPSRSTFKTFVAIAALADGLSIAIPLYCHGRFPSVLVVQCGSDMDRSLCETQSKNHGVFLRYLFSNLGLRWGHIAEICSLFG